MLSFNRRKFLKASGLTILPSLIPGTALLAANKKNRTDNSGEDPVLFYGDGVMFNPPQYIEQLKMINEKQTITKDQYGAGGAVAALEKKFEEITGKEKSRFIPSGTLANQLAIAVLSGNNTKVFVQDTSHVYRDEADAAQSVFQKRLMPLAKEKPFFTMEMLKEAIENLPQQEVFTSGIGAVSIENPVRRSDGRMVPVEEIRKISAYCRANDIKLHLDGARIYMAAAWSGVTVKEYASYFDTIYISLYKYLGASAGAVLSGDKSVMEKIPHLVKIHGGTMYGNWANAAMALDRLTGMEERLENARKRADEIFTELAKIPAITIRALEGGTNIYSMVLGKGLDGKKLQDVLSKQYNIRMGWPNEKNEIMLTVNETVLYREAAYIIESFQQAAKKAEI